MLGMIFHLFPVPQSLPLSYWECFLFLSPRFCPSSSRTPSFALLDQQLFQARHATRASSVIFLEPFLRLLLRLFRVCRSVHGPSANSPLCDHPTVGFSSTTPRTQPPSVPHLPGGSHCEPNSVAVGFRGQSGLIFQFLYQRAAFILSQKAPVVIMPI